MKSKILSLIVAATALMSGSCAYASTTSATIDPTITVTGTCVFNQTNYAINLTGMVGTKPTGSVIIQAKCSPGMTANISANYIQAYIADGSGNSNMYVEAQSFVDAARTQNLKANPITIIADGTFHPYTLYLTFLDLYGQGVLNRIGTYNIDLPLRANF